MADLEGNLASQALFACRMIKAAWHKPPRKADILKAVRRCEAVVFAADSEERYEDHLKHIELFTTKAGIADPRTAG